MTVRCFQLWKNCSKEQVGVLRDHPRLTTTDVSCQVWQNRRERAPGNSLLLGERMVSHRSYKRTNWERKMWARVSQAARQSVSSRLHFQRDPTVQSRAGLPWVAFVPFVCALWASSVLLQARRRAALVALNGSALELVPWKTRKLQLQSSCFYLGISPECSLVPHCTETPQKARETEKPHLDQLITEGNCIPNE